MATRQQISWQSEGHRNERHQAKAASSGDTAERPCQVAMDTLSHRSALKSAHEHAKKDSGGVPLPEWANGKPVETDVKEHPQIVISAK